MSELRQSLKLMSIFLYWSKEISILFTESIMLTIKDLQYNNVNAEDI